MRSTFVGNAKKIIDPAATPSTEPTANDSANGQRTCSSNMPARPIFEPICTTPCTGNAIAGVSTLGNTASMAIPPPNPMALLINEVTPLSRTNRVATKGETSAGNHRLRASAALIDLPYCVHHVFHVNYFGRRPK